MVSSNKISVNSAQCSSMLFRHFANSRPISTFTPFFFMLTPTAWNVSKLSWFPSLSSWRRRNFLGKRLTFLATRELRVQPKPGCFALSSAPVCIRLWTNNLLSGREGGREGGRQGSRIGALDCPPCWKVLLNWPRASQWMCWMLMLNSSQREERFVSPCLDLRMWERPDSCVGGYWGLC